MACKGQYFATAVNNYFNLHITLLFTILWTFAAHNKKTAPRKPSTVSLLLVEWGTLYNIIRPLHHFSFLLSKLST